MLCLEDSQQSFHDNLISIVTPESMIDCVIQNNLIHKEWDLNMKKLEHGEKLIDNGNTLVNK